MVGSRSLSTAVVHQRTDLKALWSSHKYVELARIWKDWPALRSISVRSLRPKVLIAWPASLETLPIGLTHLRFEFCHCIELFLGTNGIMQHLASLQTLELVDRSKEPMLEDVISLTSLPTGLRTLRLKTLANSSYNAKDLSTLPPTLEVLDCDLWTQSDDGWNESTEDRFAAEPLFPASLTHLELKELFSHLSSLPTSLTHLHVEHGDILDFLHNPNAQAPSTLLQPNRNKFSLKTLFPGLRHLHFGFDLAVSYAVLDDLPASLTSVFLGSWGSIGPGWTFEAVSSMLEPNLERFTRFQADIDHPFLHRLALRMPRLRTLRLMTEGITKSEFPPSLTELDDEVVSIETLPLGLQSLRCRDILIDGGSVFKLAAMNASFPQALQRFCIVDTNVLLTSDIVKVLPSTLTELQVTVGDSQEVWLAMSKHLTSLTRLEAADSPPELAGLPSSAALFPRQLRHLVICGGCEALAHLNPPSSYGSWFRDGLASLAFLETLNFTSAVVHQDMVRYLPSSLKSLSGPASIWNLGTAAHLPRQLETLILRNHLDFVSLSAEHAALLPRSLTHLDATITVEEPRKVVAALPAHLSFLRADPNINNMYYVRLKVLSNMCDPVMVKFRHSN